MFMGVLVVEDTRDVAHVLVDYLRELGHDLPSSRPPKRPSRGSSAPAPTRSPSMSVCPEQIGRVPSALRVQHVLRSHHRRRRWGDRAGASYARAIRISEDSRSPHALSEVGSAPDHRPAETAEGVVIRLTSTLLLPPVDTARVKSAAALAAPTIEDNVNLRGVGELSKDEFVEVRPFARHDEEELWHPSTPHTRIDAPHSTRVTWVVQAFIESATKRCAGLAGGR